MKTKILFVQFANSMYKRYDCCDEYWETFYQKYNSFGYYKEKHYFEIPKWIAEIEKCPLNSEVEE